MGPDPGVAEAPALPAELAGEMPRSVRLTGTGIGTVIVFAILSLASGIGCLHIHTLIVQRTQQATLPSAGVETTSEITRVWLEGRTTRTGVPRVSYNFEANGTTVMGEAEVPKRLLQSVEESKTLPVRYLPGNPAVNYPADWTPPAVPTRGMLIISLIVMVAADVAGLLVLWRHAQLVAQGIPVHAVVTRCSRVGWSGYRVRYEFRTSEGVAMRGVGRCGSTQEIGAKIWVLYWPENPRRSCPHPPLSLRVALP